MEIIKIEKIDGKWYLTLDGKEPSTKYCSLYKLAKALLAYAKGQKL